MKLFVHLEKKGVVEILRRYSAMELEFRPEDSVVEVFAEGKDNRNFLTVYEHDIGPKRRNCSRVIIEDWVDASDKTSLQNYIRSKEKELTGAP